MRKPKRAHCPQGPPSRGAVLTTLPPRIPPLSGAPLRGASTPRRALQYSLVLLTPMTRTQSLHATCCRPLLPSPRAVHAVRQHRPNATARSCACGCCGGTLPMPLPRTYPRRYRLDAITTICIATVAIPCYIAAVDAAPCTASACAASWSCGTSAAGDTRTKHECNECQRRAC